MAAAVLSLSGRLRARRCAEGVWPGGGAAGGEASRFLGGDALRWRRECHAGGGEAETQLSINGGYKAPRAVATARLSFNDQTCPSPGDERGETLKFRK